MALDTALGMRFLHSQKVMHRDLKTENLLVLAFSRPCLTRADTHKSVSCVVCRVLCSARTQVNSLQVDAETVVKISDLGISRFSEGNDALMTIGRGTTKW
jgi:serine/threonine protein kinase